MPRCTSWGSSRRRTCWTFNRCPRTSTPCRMRFGSGWIGSRSRGPRPFSRTMRHKDFDRRSRCGQPSLASRPATRIGACLAHRRQRGRGPARSPPPAPRRARRPPPGRGVEHAGSSTPVAMATSAASTSRSSGAATSSAATSAATTAAAIGDWHCHRDALGTPAPPPTPASRPRRPAPPPRSATNSSSWPTSPPPPRARRLASPSP